MKRLHEYTDEELSVATKLDVRVIDKDDAPTTDAELARLSLCKQLTHFQADGAAITDAGVAHIAQVTTLTSLFLTCPSLTDACFSHLEKLVNLTDLVLQGAAGVTGAEFGRLSKQLTSLTVATSGITNQSLSALKSFATLKSLNISCTAVTNEGLPALKDIATLDRLILGGFGITDDAVPHVSELTGLRMLSFARDCGMTVVGKARIQIALPNCFIR